MYILQTKSLLIDILKSCLESGKIPGLQNASKFVWCKFMGRAQPRKLHFFARKNLVDIIFSYHRPIDKKFLPRSHTNN